MYPMTRSPRPIATPRQRRLRADTRDSRDRLLRAAERLFAERGIDGVSLREINQASGQKNVSGLQYHFGTKTNLLAAVFGYRGPGIDVRRKGLLDEMKRTGRTSDLRQILTAMVVPFAERSSIAATTNALLRALRRPAL